MSSYLTENNNFIYFLFKKEIIADFNEIFFTINNNITYYDNSHISYVAIEQKNDKTYTFNGFYKDNLLIISIDIYDELLKINIEHKDILLIKINWVLKKMDENQSVWIIDIPIWKKINIEYFILPIRKNIFSDQSLNIEDYIKINNLKINNVEIKYANEKKKIYKLKDYFKYLLY